MTTCRTTLPRCPAAFAAGGYCGSTGCVSNSSAAASERCTGSIADIAASAGLFPLASGVVEAICDFRLDGIPVPLAADTACGGGTLPTAEVTSCGCGVAARTTGGVAGACAAAGSTTGFATGVLPGALATLAGVASLL